MNYPDRFFVYKCGQGEWNPKLHRHRTYQCPDCKERTHHVVIFCEGHDDPCNQPIIVNTKQLCRKKFCDKCRDALALERRHQRNRGVQYKCPQIDGAMSLQEIADHEGITREYARQIFVRAMKKFRKNWIRMYPDLPDPTVPTGPTYIKRQGGWF